MLWNDIQRLARKLVVRGTSDNKAGNQSSGGTTRK